MNDAGVILYDPVRNHFRHVNLGEEMLDIHSFWQDDDGKVWIGSENGIFSCHDGKVIKEVKYYNNSSPGIIYSIMRARDGNLWVGTNGGGVDIFDRDGNKVGHPDGLPSEHVNHVIQDDDGDIWISTYEGVCRISDDSCVCVYEDCSGLLDNNARAMACDRSGNIWVSTYSGISRIDKSTGAICNYNYEDGVPLGGFVEGGVTTLNDGTLMFSSPNGVCCFNPQLMNTDYKVSPIEIVDCEKLDVNAYKFTFSVRNYSQTGQVEYAYLLDGFNGDWHTTDGESYMTIRDIPPGKYVFKVRARWKNGRWNDEDIASVPVVVDPPLWATWWAMVLYLIIVMIICWQIIKLYKRHLKQKNSLELQQNILEVEKKQRLDEQELNNERLRFYTNIAHEIRTPLTLIIGPLEDLLHDKGMPQGYHRKVNVIHQSAMRLLYLVNQIMEFRKTETHNRQLVVVKDTVLNLVKEIVFRYKELNRNDKLEIELVSTDVPAIFFDYDVISTILDNLLSNAVKYTPEGTITVTVESVENDGLYEIKISVSDTGYGIEREALPHIFERYYQAHGAHQTSGTGIGLALVRSLANLHHGRVTVRSEVGTGTTFELYLPVDDSYPQARHKEDRGCVTAAPKLFDDGDDGRQSVLVVEDNDDIRRYIADILDSEYNVIQCRNGREGLDAAIGRVPDVVLSDIMMPELDGMEMCRLLKNNLNTSHIPVILLTAKDSLEDKERGYECGADSYLTKPFTAKLLKNRIKNLFDARSKLAEYIIDKSKDITVIGNDMHSMGGTSLPRLNRLDREFLERFIHLIESNLNNDKFNMDFITSNMNMSYSSLYRKVKALTGVTANEFIRKIKLRNSVRLMLSGECNISEAAMMAGFNNLGHFREAFKEEYGVTPSQYIRQYRC